MFPVGISGNRQIIATAFPGGNLIKIGAGTIRYSGMDPNFFSGTTIVAEGTLETSLRGGTDETPSADSL